MSVPADAAGPPRLEEWLAGHPDDGRPIEDTPDFLRAAAFESLRLTVGASVRLRTATEDVTLPSGLAVEKGQTIALLLIPANMTKSRFGDDADAYNPHRDMGNAAPFGGLPSAPALMPAPAGRWLPATVA